jgi:hypothetical protein
VLVPAHLRRSRGFAPSCPRLFSADRTVSKGAQASERKSVQGKSALEALLSGSARASEFVIDLTGRYE